MLHLQNSEWQGQLVWPARVVAVLSSKPNLLCVSQTQHCTISLLMEKESQTTHTLRRYILAGWVDKEGQWHEASSALPPPLFLLILGGCVVCPLSHTHLVSLIHSDLVFSLETVLPCSWHVPTVSELPGGSCLIFKNNITYRTEQYSCWLKNFAGVLGTRECPSHLHSCALTLCVDYKVLWELC